MKEESIEGKGRGLKRMDGEEKEEKGRKAREKGERKRREKSRTEG